MLYIYSAFKWKISSYNYCDS